MNNNNKLNDQYVAANDLKTDSFAQHQLSEIRPMIGDLVMDFNRLQASLNNFLCELFTDRTDSGGLMVLHNMNYQTKVELFKGFCDDFHHGITKKIAGYDPLMVSLIEAGRLKTMVIDSAWHDSNESFSYVAVAQEGNAPQFECVPFTKGALDKVLDVIACAHQQLCAYYAARQQLFDNWGKVS